MKKNSRNEIKGPGKVNKYAVKPPARTIADNRSFYERPLFLVILLLLVTFIGFVPSLKNSFIPTWDDNVYVTDNHMIRHLDGASLKAMFTTTVNGTYVPLPLLFFAIEYSMFGLNPLPYHIFSILLHLVCTFLVFYFLRQLRLKNIYALFGALLFGIHPMHVESVAWITELKDLLFSLFYLCSLIFYIRYLQTREGRWKFFFLSMTFFILSLFSKIQAVSLPLSLFLLDYLFERPYKSRLVIEKIPFLSLSLVFGIAGVLVIHNEGALMTGVAGDLLQRTLMGLYALSAYIVKFFMPFHLSALYPVPLSAGKTLPWLYYLSPVFLLMVAFFVYRSAGHTRAVVFGTLFFLVNIMFLLQIVGVGTAFMADRFSYIPYIGLGYVSAWALEMAIERKKEMTYTIIAAVSVILALFIYLTFERSKTWKNGETLWTDVIEKYPDGSSRPYSNRSVLFNEKGLWDRSIADCSKAIGIDPNDVYAYSNRSVAFANTGAFDRALADCSKAIGIKPDFANAWSNRGNAYLGIKEWNLAIADYTKAIGINPNESNAYANRAVAYGNLGEWDKAIADLTTAIGINPNNIKAWSNRGSVYVTLREPDKAIADYTMAIKIDPEYANAYFNRGTVYGDLGAWDKAIADYSKAIEINPNLQAAYKNREVAYQNLVRSK